MINIYGASQTDWLHFDLMLGLTSDLLPVVSNPDAEISSNSTLKTVGKTPSKYNRDGKAVGIASWTSKQSTANEIEKWSQNSDYGICIQTRNIRAIDVDVSDEKLAQEIDKFIAETLQIKLPKRFRANSSKFLLMFEMQGEYSKQIIKLDDNNIVEFLANGQQFIAVGTHTSGARYEWQNELPSSIPTLTFAEFENVWNSLAEMFKGDIISAKESRVRDLSNKDAFASDEVAEYLDQNWEVYGVGKAGERYIRCPFDHEHTSESNDTATAYFPKSTGGFDQGHFRCLHAHCMSRDDTEFLDAINFRENTYFDVIPVEPNELPLPKFVRDNHGKINATINNVYLAVQRNDICGVNIRFDQFRDEIMYCPLNSDQWITFSDADYTRIRIILEKGGFKAIGREMIRDAVLLVADENPFDSATEWLSRLVWDGVPRIETFLFDHFNAEQNEYTKAVSLYLWTALAGRVIKPGIKADMVPVLVGEQGCGKSTGVAALSPNVDYFCEVSFAEKDDDLARKMRGRLVAEIGELRGLHSKELESIKAFITRTHENWIPKYREFATQFPRRLVFIGTSNQDEFLADETGNRRFLPVRVSAVNVDAVKANRDQLWAEAKALFNKSGIQFNDAERLARAEHEQFMIKDAWQEAVENWLNAESFDIDELKPIDRPYLTANEVLRGAIGLDNKNIGRREEMRISKTLQALGYKKTVTKLENRKSIRVFVRKTASCN